ncbi:MAG: putative zinc-binding metallopeptidase [Thermodesulfobacteriota bacterium]|nr:putative zinc-binding metallopeptidase [Thermodesulfobacteriota bacterium]
MATARDILNNWETKLMEMNKPISELNLKIEGTLLEKLIGRLYAELNRKGIILKPKCYLTDTWGCPNKVPVIGIPFYYADATLSKIQDEMQSDLEDEHELMMTLRHEAGHAINYAYLLYKSKEWQDTFGLFSEPYRDYFHPNPQSKEFVKHLHQQVGQYSGRIYAQKHPDEDFAETFAVWLTPRSNWRQKYKNWSALKKLHFVDRLMKQIGPRKPLVTNGELIRPIESLNFTLLEYYNKSEERYREKAQGYVDDVLREIFNTNGKGETRIPAGVFIEQNRNALVEMISHWTGEGGSSVGPLIDKFVARARELNLNLSSRRQSRKLIEVTALATTLIMNYIYEGKFIVP